MTDYVGGLQQFGLDTANTVEVVLHSGQKIQFTSAAKTTVQRPNKLYVSRIGDVVSQSLYYDDRTLTLVNPDDGVYATVAAPSTLDAMIDFARDSLDVIAPAGVPQFRYRLAALGGRRRQADSAQAGDHQQDLERRAAVHFPDEELEDWL